MANLDFSFMNTNEELKLSDLQDRLYGLQRQMNWGMRNLDSLNVKRLNTEITIIKSEGGEMDLTGRNIKMYDETSRLRFRVGLSTADVYDMTMWSSNAATTDYDFSSNASMYINSSGEAVFADTIRTGKDAIVGRNLFVGKNNTTDKKSIRLQAFSTGTGSAEDIALRTIYSAGGLLGAEIGMLHSSDDSTDAIRALENIDFVSFQGLNIYGAAMNLFGNGAGSFTINGATDALYINSDTYISISAAEIIISASSGIYINTDTNGNAIGDVVMPYAQSFQGNTNSSSIMLTVGFAADAYVANLSAGIQTIGLDWTSDFPNEIDFYLNGFLEFSVPSKELTVLNESTDRLISLDYTTATNRLMVFRNSTFIDTVVMSGTTEAIKLTIFSSDGFLPYVTLNSTIAAYLARSGAAVHRFEWSTASSELELRFNSTNVAYFIDKGRCVQNYSTATQLTLQYLTLASTVGSVLATSGEYIVIYTSGLVFKGGIKVDT